MLSGQLAHISDDPILRIELQQPSYRLSQPARRIPTASRGLDPVETFDFAAPNRPRQRAAPRPSSASAAPRRTGYRTSNRRPSYPAQDFFVPRWAGPHDQAGSHPRDPRTDPPMPSTRRGAQRLYTIPAVLAIPFHPGCSFNRKLCWSRGRSARTRTCAGDDRTSVVRSRTGDPPPCDAPMTLTTAPHRRATPPMTLRTAPRPGAEIPMTLKQAACHRAQS